MPEQFPAAPLYRKPEPDLYTALLVIALAAILMAILFLCLEMKEFKYDLSTPAVGLVYGPLLMPRARWLRRRGG